MSEPISWSNEVRLITELIPAKYNPRQASEKEENDLAISLARFSLADPIIINRNNTVIGGHFRLRMLQKQGAREVDVRVPNRMLSEKEERELNLRLNKNTGSWDFGILGGFCPGMLSDVGFDSEDLMLQFGKIQAEEVDVDQERIDAITVEAPESPRLKARQSFYCRNIAELNEIKAYFAAGRDGVLDMDKLLNLIRRSAA